MKLIIQIPCYNEEATLPATVADLPRQIEGIDEIEIQVINDGSKDGTLEVARGLKVDHVVNLDHNRGLAQAFRAGIENALRNGADIIVNTDADNQYCGADISALVKPILTRQADMVLGERPIDTHPEFSASKKLLQKLGSMILRQASRTTVPDAASGFRAYTADAAMRLNVITRFSYCLETLIQAGYSNLKVTSVPVRVNPCTRESRLFRNTPEYLLKSGFTIIRVFIVYRASLFFTALGVVPLMVSLLLACRYAYLVFVLQRNVTAFWPSIVLAGFLLVVGFQLVLTGVLAELVASNRKLTEELLYQQRKATFRPDNPER